jgi:hypothetical protein
MPFLETKEEVTSFLSYKEGILPGVARENSMITETRMLDCCFVCHLCQKHHPFATISSCQRKSKAERFLSILIVQQVFRKAIGILDHKEKIEAVGH